MAGSLDAPAHLRSARLGRIPELDFRIQLSGAPNHALSELSHGAHGHGSGVSELSFLAGKGHLGRAGRNQTAPGWVNLLPVFGGAIGGVVAGAITASSGGYGATT